MLHILHNRKRLRVWQTRIHRIKAVAHSSLLNIVIVCFLQISPVKSRLYLWIVVIVFATLLHVKDEILLIFPQTDEIIIFPPTCSLTSDFWNALFISMVTLLSLCQAPLVAVTVLLTEAPSITIAVWLVHYAICSGWVWRATISWNFARLLAGFCVATFATFFCSQMCRMGGSVSEITGSSPDRKGHGHSCIATSALCTGNLNLLIFYFSIVYEKSL